MQFSCDVYCFILIRRISTTTIFKALCIDLNNMHIFFTIDVEGCNTDWLLKNILPVILTWHDVVKESLFVIVCLSLWLSERLLQTRALKECRPLQGISSTDQESTSGWSGVWIRIRFRAGWLPKFNEDFFLQRYIWDKIFLKIRSLFREIRAKYCGKMPYHLTVLKNL